MVSGFVDERTPGSEGSDSGQDEVASDIDVVVIAGDTCEGATKCVYAPVSDHAGEAADPDGDGQPRVLRAFHPG
jgi:hypothetical protein